MVVKNLPAVQETWVPSLGQEDPLEKGVVNKRCPQREKCPAFSHIAAAAKSLQSCLTLCDPIDGSPPDSPVPGIFQARTLEWSEAISFSNA